MFPDFYGKIFSSFGNKISGTDEFAKIKDRILANTDF